MILRDIPLGAMCLCNDFGWLIPVQRSNMGNVVRCYRLDDKSLSSYSAKTFVGKWVRIAIAPGGNPEIRS